MRTVFIIDVYFLEPNKWFHNLVVVVNYTINGLIVIIYVVLPTLASIRIRMCLQQVSKGSNMIGTDKETKDHTRNFLRDIRRLSFVYLLCFLFCECSAVIVCDTIARLFPNDLQSLAIEVSICNMFIQLNSVYHLYIWLLSAKFRKELFAMFYANVFVNRCFS